MSYNYGQEPKQVYFEMTDGEHAKLVIKLRHQRMGQGEFFRFLVSSYILDHPLIDQAVDEYRKTKKNYSLTKERFLFKERDQAEKLSDMFCLDENEIEDIYDLLEEESEI